MLQARIASIEQNVQLQDAGRRKQIGALRRGFAHVNCDEIYCIIGLWLIFGIARLPSLKDHWSRNDMLNSNYVATVMSRDRFLALHACFRVQPVNDPGDSISKVHVGWYGNAQRWWEHPIVARSHICSCSIAFVNSSCVHNATPRVVAALLLQLSA